MTKRTLLITGATGNQGGAAIRALLKQGDDWTLRAIVRNPESERAKALQAKGVELVKGDLNDERAVTEAVKGAYGVFSVQTAQEEGPEVEAKQGKLLASTAANVGISHFIYSSAGGAERNSGIPHFESKWEVEQHIRSLALPATVFRPVAFMDNFGPFMFRTIMLSLWKTYMPDGQKLQLIAADDIGWFVARAFSEPSEYIGKAVELGGDAVTRPRAIQMLKQAGRGPVVSFRIPKPLLNRLPKEFTLMFSWMAQKGFAADLPALRHIDPELKLFEQWAARTPA